MEMGEVVLKTNNSSNSNIISNNRVVGGGEGGGCSRAHAEKKSSSAATDFVLQWGNGKRLRCMKIQQVRTNDSATESRPRNRFDRAVLRAHRDPPNLRPPLHRISRNCEASGSGTTSAMKVQTSFSPERILRGDRGDHNHHHHNHNHNQQDQKLQDKKNNSNNNNNNNEGSGGAGASAASSETAQDSKRGGGSSSGSDAIAVWLPKFEIGLTTKEKEEDFMAIKGSKLPLRPKKRAKFVQRTLNFVCPGTLLCDLTLERYEVREKKVSKKRPRGLKAMGNMESDSE